MSQIKNLWKKPQMQVVVIAISAVIGLIYLAFLKPIPSASSEITTVLSNPLLPTQSTASILESEIPPYFVEAVRHDVVATNLHRVELEMPTQEEEILDESLAVLDKVVVAPKILPANTQKINTQEHKKIITNKKYVLAQKALGMKFQYTIQILASQDMHRLQAFVSAHHLKNKAKIRKTYRDGHAWYVLTLGEYLERKDAHQAAAHLSKDVSQLHPWVRALSDFKMKTV